MKSPTNNANENQRTEKSKRDDQARDAETKAEEPGRVKRGARVVLGKGSGAVDRKAVLATQQQLGNAFVQRQLRKRGSAHSTKPDGIQRAPADESSRPTSIGDDSTSVTAQNGLIEFNGTMARGTVIQADTVIADSIVASSYTPGAGNVQ